MPISQSKTSRGHLVGDARDFSRSCHPLFSRPTSPTQSLLSLQCIPCQCTDSGSMLINKSAGQIWHNLKCSFDGITIKQVTGVAVNILNNCFSNYSIPQMNHWTLCPYHERKVKDQPADCQMLKSDACTGFH